LRELKIRMQNRVFVERYKSYLSHKEFIEQNPHLLSAEAYGYRRGYGGMVVIPFGYKKLSFTEKQIEAINGHWKKALTEPSNNVPNNLKVITDKLNDPYTALYWSGHELHRAMEKYTNSLSNWNFSPRLIHKLIRKAEVTDIHEFRDKSLEEYKYIFGSSSAIFKEISNLYEKYTEQK